jgi:predicted dehydrogenase
VSERTNSGLTRREMIQTTGGLAVASALAGVAIPHVHAAEESTIRIALVGCGGRGTGAAGDALSSKNGPTRLVAMADVFPDHVERTYKNLSGAFGPRVDVPKEHRFVSFQGYKQAMDCLRPGDVVILATPPAFRWVHFTYAIQKGLNVFMEKPIAVDGPSARKMFKLGEDAAAKNLKVAVGLMCRHCIARQQLFDRIKNGEMGDILLLRAYRMAGHTAKESAPKRKEGMSELLHQIYWFHSFLWASGGCYSDFLIHHIDECCWMKDAWPTSAKGSGGRVYPNGQRDQNFDTYSIEYTFPDGAKLYLEGRTVPGCYQDFASYAHGTKGSAWISKGGHSPAHCRIFKNQHNDKDDHPAPNSIAWRFPTDNEPNPYQTEWDDLLAAIKAGKTYNEVQRGAEASLVTAMGRMAAHTGQRITRDQILNCEHEFAPDVDKLTFDSPAPVQASADGKYPVPQPGKKHGRWQEYY